MDEQIARIMFDTVALEMAKSFRGTSRKSLQDKLKNLFRFPDDVSLVSNACNNSFEVNISFYMENRGENIAGVHIFCNPIEGGIVAQGNVDMGKASYLCLPKLYHQ